MLLYNKQIFERHFKSGLKLRYLIADIPRYFRELRYLMKYGYDRYATWELRSWFPMTMKDILQEYRNCHHGYPIVTDNCPMYSNDKDENDKRLRKENNEKWDAIIDRMIELLGLMDEGNPVYEDEHPANAGERRTAAKNEFFVLFSEYFWALWD